MSEELRHVCEHCNGAMKYPAEGRGQSLACPHCKSQTILGGSVASQSADCRVVTEDEAKVKEWLHKANKLNDAEAQFNLGLSYAKGQGVPKDETVAVKWYRKYNQVRPHSRLGYESPAAFAARSRPSPAPVGLRPPCAGDGQRTNENLNSNLSQD